MLEYNSEFVGQLMVLGLEQQDAVDCLRACNNDVVKAADFFFNQGLEEWRQKHAWDEGAFHRDRYNSLEALEPLTGWGSNSLNVNNPPRTSTSSAAEFSHLSLPMMRYLGVQDSSRVGIPSDVGGEDHQHLLGDGVGDDMFGHGSERATAYSSSHSNADYSIQAPDVLTPEVLGGPPRTRPSSPMNPGLDGDTNRSDADIARALQMSFNNESYNSNDYHATWENQDTGITGTHSTPTATYFGPATRASYDEAQWALTVPVTHEIYLDPAHPSDRQRKIGEPAFFKPSSDGYHLGPALAILHSIPAAREALLAQEYVLDDYGYNDRWWSGEKIEASRITDITDNEGTGEIIVGPEPSQVVMEVQRLMAFLDRTTRGYGSVDSLAKMDEVSELLQGGQLPTFFKKWSCDIKGLCNMEGEHDPQPFTSIAVETGDLLKKKPFQVLEVSVSDDLANTLGSTLYNALDSILWGENDQAGDVYFEHVSDVLCIALKRDTTPSEFSGGGIGLDIPTEIYMDRYSEKLLHAVRGMKSEKERLKSEIRKLECREEKLLHCRQSKAVVDTSTVEITKLLEAAIEHFEHLRVSIDGKVSTDESGDVAMGLEEGRPDDFQHMKEHIKGILNRLKTRLAELASSKERACQALQALTTAFTSPETSSEAAPLLTRHSLRGVFIDLSTTFIKTRSTAGEVEREDWWCLSYPLQWESDGNSAPYKVLKASEKEMLDAAKYTGDGKILLVYATEEALKPRESDGKLPEPLKNFVERDNFVFGLELDNAGDNCKRKSSNWFNTNATNTTETATIGGSSIPHITIDDSSGSNTMDNDYNQGGNQIPVSSIDLEPTEVTSPPQEKSPEGEWPVRGEPIPNADHSTLNVGAEVDSGWASGQAWERMEDTEGGENIEQEVPIESGYDDSIAAGDMSSFVQIPVRAEGWPEAMSIERTRDAEDEDMRDAQHVEFVEEEESVGLNGGRPENGSSTWEAYLEDK